MLFVFPYTQNSENDLFNPNITFCISCNKYIKLINSFGLGRHLLMQDIVVGTDATLGCFKQNSFNIHILQYFITSCLVIELK